MLVKKAISNASDGIEKDWSLAWRWRRLNEWLLKLHSRESVESLQTRLERARRKERELIRELVVERTWQRQIADCIGNHPPEIVRVIFLGFLTEIILITG